MADDGYSQIADEQLDAIEEGPDADSYNTTLDACDLIFKMTPAAQSRSSAITTSQGIVFRLPVVGHEPYKVFWSLSDDGPRVEAVFPHP